MLYMVCIVSTSTYTLAVFIAFVYLDNLNYTQDDNYPHRHHVE